MNRSSLFQSEILVCTKLNSGVVDQVKIIDDRGSLMEVTDD